MAKRGHRGERIITSLMNPLLSNRASADKRAFKERRKGDSKPRPQEKAGHLRQQAYHIIIYVCKLQRKAVRFLAYSMFIACSAARRPAAGMS